MTPIEDLVVSGSALTALVTVCAIALVTIGAMQPDADAGLSGTYSTWSQPESPDLAEVYTLAAQN